MVFAHTFCVHNPLAIRFRVENICHTKSTQQFATRFCVQNCPATIFSKSGNATRPFLLSLTGPKPFQPQKKKVYGTARTVFSVVLPATTSFLRLVTNDAK